MSIGLDFMSVCLLALKKQKSHNSIYHINLKILQIAATLEISAMIFLCVLQHIFTINTPCVAGAVLQTPL